MDPTTAVALGGAAAWFGRTVLGAPLTQIGDGLADAVRAKRFERQVALFDQAHQILTSRNGVPVKVDWKVLFPLLDGAANEEDGDMFQRWAALLANAADERTRQTVRPAFPTILAQLSPSDALVLDLVFSECATSGAPSETWPSFCIRELQEKARLESGIYQLSAQNLVRLGLLMPPGTRFDFTTADAIFPTRDFNRLGPTELGLAFMTACRPSPWPEPKKVDENGLRRITGNVGYSTGNADLSDDLLAVESDAPRKAR